MSENGQTDLLEALGFYRALEVLKHGKVARYVGYGLAALFTLALLAATFQLIRTIFTGYGEHPVANLGTGAMIVAVLSSPFLAWNTVIRNSALGYQKEGHLTDRLSKAVEQLGSEKTVQNIGRPVTIWTGESAKEPYVFQNDEPITLPPRSIELGRNLSLSSSADGEERRRTEVTARRWASERTDIQWRGEEIDKRDGEHVGATGDWEVFTQTLPNIEVRIGGLLSLERIAQDSVTYDKGRDHVRVMEIICAYVRENANANLHGVRSKEDLKIAIEVIGRRDRFQRAAEARWGHPEGVMKDWLFDHFPPESLAKREQYARDKWNQGYLLPIERLKEYNGYQIDLSGSDLWGFDFSDGNFSGGHFPVANLSGSLIRHAELICANLYRASLIEAMIISSEMAGTRLEEANFSGTLLKDVSLIETDVSQQQVDLAFGDKSVSLPSKIVRPAHWPLFDMEIFGEEGILSQYSRWRANPDSYNPPPPPTAS